MFALSSSKIDVLVVGGGPAGATAARFLALNGARVRLLDRSVFPRNKPCGGGISARVLKRFPYLVSYLDRIGTHYLSRLRLEGPDGDSTIVESDEPAALMIRRVEFDALLLSLAVDAGVEVISGADVVQAAAHDNRVSLVARDGRTFSAPVVIAADGVHSVVARRLGLNPGWPAASVALDMMEETPRAQLRDVDPSTLWVAYGFNPDAPSAIRDGTRAHEGYAYIFPKRDHVNIGVGYVLSHYRAAVDRAPYELQQELVGRLRRRGIVEGSSVRQNFTPFIIPVGGPLRRPGRGRVLLAGDAGGFVNGVTAEGIYYAMVTGELAGRAVAERSAGVGAVGAATGIADAYKRACDHEIGTELRDSVLIQRYLFADRRRISRIVAGAPQERVVTRLILDLATGRRPYKNVRRRILVRMPAVAARFVWERWRQRRYDYR
ncbi:MAG TPA: geranylgeranyl reductase family protein [Vicinamibacterales bacterium]|jgi:geranylgeranyl reductase family protein|nr:geranylgeranyl reductase family protein [Vicinamibacterales bacterium]